MNLHINKRMNTNNTTNNHYNKLINNDNGEQKREYGYYHCRKCNRRWESGNSWKGFAQKCTRCYKPIQAYRFASLKKKDNDGDSTIDTTKPHRQDLCMKCTQLGYYCGRE